MFVYVLDRNRRPLMPTQRCGHARSPDHAENRQSKSGEAEAVYYSASVRQSGNHAAALRRLDRAIINNQRQRTYSLDGKIVAKNRKKGFAQKELSLKEYAESLPPEERQKILSRIEITPSQRRYNRKNRMLPGNVFWFAGCRYVMSGQLSGGAYLRAEG